MLKEVLYESTPKLEELSLGELWDGGMWRKDDAVHLEFKLCSHGFTFKNSLPLKYEKSSSEIANIYTKEWD